jgi:hypothetical protein
MDELESKAIKLLQIWLDKSRKMFPDYNHTNVNLKNIKKSQVFRICYKLARESQLDLSEDDYPLYVRSQLDILKHISKIGGKVSIDPNCLVGEKAWRRWKLWKSKYDKVKNKPQQSEPTIIGEQKAILGIENTYKFLSKEFGNDLSFENYAKIYENKRLFNFINMNKISPYYLVISPFIKKLMNETDFKKINFDPLLYKNCITEKVQEKFKILFFNEK